MSCGMALGYNAVLPSHQVTLCSYEYWGHITPTPCLLFASAIPCPSFRQLLFLLFLLTAVGLASFIHQALVQGRCEEEALWLAVEVCVRWICPLVGRGRVRGRGALREGPSRMG
jgi:hypothetical protein